MLLFWLDPLWIISLHFGGFWSPKAFNLKNATLRFCLLALALQFHGANALIQFVL